MMSSKSESAPGFSLGHTFLFSVFEIVLVEVPGAVFVCVLGAYANKPVSFDVMCFDAVKGLEL